MSRCIAYACVNNSGTGERSGGFAVFVNQKSSGSRDECVGRLTNMVIFWCELQKFHNKWQKTMFY